MAELKVIRREWQIEARFGEGEVPDVPKNYSSIIMRPCAATIYFISGQTGLIRLSQATVNGHRVLKSGQPGTTTTDTFHSQADMPDWLADVVTGALESILGDVNG